jgi:hypothetical protein
MINLTYYNRGVRITITYRGEIVSPNLYLLGGGFFLK